MDQKPCIYQTMLGERMQEILQTQSLFEDLFQQVTYFFAKKRHVATILRINYHQPFKLDHVSSSNFSHILVGSCSPFVTSMARRRYAQMKVRRRSLKRCC